MKKRSYRNFLSKSLVRALVLKGRIKTTEKRAKDLRGLVDRLVSRAKKADTRYLSKFLRGREVNLLMRELAVRWPKRTSGFTRILHLGGRLGDNAPMTLIEFIEAEEKPVVAKKQRKKVATRKKS